ncbi:MAG: hypothetical protein IPK82_01050 [Polyangiaceae bacterium]|nr:hypothetical protein [Polyangiaceae bacterium]
MGKKTEMLQLPTRMLAVELGSQKRWRKVVLFGGIGAVVVGGLVYAVVRAADSKSAEALNGSWTDLNTCLLGAPLKEGEGAAARVSAVQLAVVGMPKDKRGKPGEAPWPSSCAPAAFLVAENGGAAAEGGDALKASADALAKALKEDANATTDLAPLVEKVWADAKKGGLKVGAAGKGPVAPAAANVALSREAFGAVPKFLSGNFLLSDVREQASSAPPKVRFLVDSKDAANGPALCTLSPGDATIRCVKVPAEVAKMSPGLSLVGSTEDRAQPFYFAGDRGQLGIFPPTGDKIVAAAVSPGAVSRADGAFLALAKSEKGKDVGLVIAPPTGAARTAPLLSGADLDHPLQAGLFWDWLVFKGPARGGAAKISARRVGPNGAEGAAIEVGTTDEASPSNDKEVWVTGCRSDEAMAVRVSGAATDVMAMFAGGRWTAPMKTGTRGGALSCRGVEAVSTQVIHAVDQNKNFPTIRQAKCSASGCNTTVVNVREMLGSVADIAPADASGIAVADINGKLLIVWNAGGAGGLRMRFAPAERMKDAEDQVITDGRDATGSAKASTINEVRVLSGSTHGVILVGTTMGVRALVIDGAGVVKAASASL